MGAAVKVDGDVAPGFEGVRDAFAANFEQHQEVGAAVAVYVRGEKVVDLWGGVADVEADRPWERDTTCLVFSTTKGVAAIVAHLLAQRGVLDLDAPVSQYWPEFAAEGKGDVPVRWLLGHRVGLPTIEPSITPEEALAWDPAVARLAAQRPLWEPGTRHGYHALTYGWLVGEVVRRVTGRSLGTVLAEEICTPLDLDLWIGAPESEEQRVAPLIPFVLGEMPDPALLAMLPDDLKRLLAAMTDPTSLTVRALQVTDPPLEYNSREMRAAELPAANGVATARSLARLYAACVGEVDGQRLLDPATVADASREVSNGPDEVLMVPTRFGSGFMLASPFCSMLGPNSFGHPGAGGSLAFGDPDAQVGFGYVMNKMLQNLSNDLRPLTLINAVREAVS